MRGAFSAGTRQRNAHRPENRASIFGAIFSRIAEWMPSAPMTTVRRHLRLARGPAGETKFDFVLRLPDVNAPVIQAQVPRGKRRLQQRQEIGAVRDVAMRAVEPLALLAHGLHEQHTPVLPASELPRGFEPDRRRRAACRRVRVPQQAHHVGRNNDSRSDFPQFRRLLVDCYIVSRLAQEQRGSQAAQAASHDRNPQAQVAFLASTARMPPRGSGTSPA
jgi:hypothetical protein